MIYTVYEVKDGFNPEEIYSKVIPRIKHGERKLKIWSEIQTVTADGDYKQCFVLYLQKFDKTVHVAYSMDMIESNRTRVIEVLQAGIKQLCFEVLPEPSLNDTIRDKIAELKKEIAVLENIVKYSGDQE